LREYVKKHLNHYEDNRAGSIFTQEEFDDLQRDEFLFDKNQLIQKVDLQPSPELPSREEVE
jgi:hypothetical protein